jgi:branched-chain amino acid transport system permease protein
MINLKLQLLLEKNQPLNSVEKKIGLWLCVWTLTLILLPWISLVGGTGWLRILNLSLLYIMLSLGLNIIVGFAGLLDLGYIAFYAIGAYLYALLASPHLIENFPALATIFPNGLHANIIWVIPLAALIAGIFGALLGAPTLKLRGDYLAIVTLGFGEIIRIFMNNLNAPINITNGPQGINMIEPIQMGTINFNQGITLFNFKAPSLILYYYLFLAMVFLIVAISLRLKNSRLGRAWQAIAEDELAAKAMGINTRNIKLAAFALAASFGGVAGSLFAASQGFISPESFGLMESLVILSMIVLGGLGNITGVILGSVLLSIFPEILRAGVIPLQECLFGKVVIDAEIIRSLLLGLAMILIMRYRPNGIWSK